MKRNVCTPMKFILICILLMPLEALAGYDEAMENLKAGNAEAFKSEIILLAQQGDGRAQFYLGHMYLNGGTPGISIDVNKAVLWFRKSADQGIEGSEFQLGEMYRGGIGVPKDINQAVVWYQKVAEQGKAHEGQAKSWLRFLQAQSTMPKTEENNSFRSAKALQSGQPSADDFDFVARVMVDLFRARNLQYLCLPQSSTLQTVRTSLNGKLKGIDLNVTTQENANAIATVIYTALPCPFSPDKPELRPATKEDILGNWITPESSVKLRYGPKSPQWQSHPGMPPLRCEGVTYNPDGQLLTVQALGSQPCPTSKDMEAMQKMSKVETWNLLREGRLQSIHTARPVSEEWDIFVVEKPFEFVNISFAAGDLVAYLRRSKGNDLNVSTVFRHLQRLP